MAAERESTLMLSSSALREAIEYNLFDWKNITFGKCITLHDATLKRATCGFKVGQTFHKVELDYSHSSIRFYISNNEQYREHVLQLSVGQLIPRRKPA